MDMLFFGYIGGTPEDYGGSYEAGVRYGAKWPRHDMAPMIPLMAKAAFGVGFAITMSTTYHHPFYVARFLMPWTMSLADELPGTPLPLPTRTKPRITVSM